ncbi:unnamed protein product [Periconia digitata]|uniref:Uncharacterized protein n=1 Tax=Periconia digitata TaxID=1303443 RepID=A0A9W4XD12_9PLEO|nr:unnamed protein product [Periconia digitata]
MSMPGCLFIKRFLWKGSQSTEVDVNGEAAWHGRFSRMIDHWKPHHYRLGGTDDRENSQGRIRVIKSCVSTLVVQVCYHQGLVIDKTSYCTRETHLPFANTNSNSQPMFVRSRGRFIDIDDYELSNWLPNLWSWCSGGILNLQQLSLIICNHNLLPRRFSVAHTLGSFFGLFRRRRWRHRARLDYRIHDQFSRILHQDRRHSYRSGLAGSLHYFSALAALANISQSQSLAYILIYVFWRNRFTIMYEERSRNLYCWAVAIELLRGLIPSSEVHRCYSYLARKRNVMRQSYYNSGISDPRIDTILGILFQMNVGMPGWHRGRGLLHNVGRPRVRSTPLAIGGPLDDYDYDDGYDFVSPVGLIEDWNGGIDRRLGGVRQDLGMGIAPGVRMIGF